MPLIELTVPRGTLPDDAAAGLLAELTEIVLDAEGAPPDNQLARDITWAYLRTADTIFASNQLTPTPRYRLDLTIPTGMLDDRRKATLVERATTAIVGAVGDTQPGATFRTWCIIHEIADGNWAADGRIQRREDVIRRVAAAGAREE